jgi:hypothetical protein
MKTLMAVALLLLVMPLSGVSPGQVRDRYHHVKSSPKVNYDSLLAAAVPLSKSSVGQTLVEGCLHTYGGMDKLKTLKDFELTYQASSKFGQESYDLVKSFGQGRRYRINRRMEQRILNGDQCWFQNSDTLLFIDQGRYRAELYSYLTLAMPLAIRTERFDTIRYGKRLDDPLGYIYLHKQDSLLIVLGIDKDDHLIRVAEGIVQQGDQHFVFINRFADYQQHEGFSFPGQVTTISLGLEVSSAKLMKVMINPGFEAQYFKPLKGPTAKDNL